MVAVMQDTVMSSYKIWRHWA